MTPPPSALSDTVASCSDTSPAVNIDALTVLGVSERRAKSVFKGGIAAAGYSEAFKGKTDKKKPHSKNFYHRLTEESKARQPSPLKAAAIHLGKDGMISLCGGMPSSAYFPFSHIDLGLPHGTGYSEQEMAEDFVNSRIGKHDMREGKSHFGTGGYLDLSVSLNYGQGTGAPQLVRWVTEHTEIVHNPPYEDWGCIMTVGSTSAFDMCLRVFLDPGDYIITDEYAFSSAVETTHGMRCKLAGVAMDSEGMIPSDLQRVLDNWDEQVRGAKKPFLLYLVPTGQNPTGCTQSLTRRKELYAIAQKNDLLIIEDEPYYFLQMNPYISHAQNGTTNGNGTANTSPPSHEEFLKSLIPSILSMDIDGRVIRLDSFSKVVAPGCRAGWVTCNSLIAERFARHNEVTVQAPSGFSQVVLYKLLDEHWGHGGYIDWLQYIKKEYSTRRDVLMGACEKYMPREVTSWVPPTAGMFLWIKVNAQKHPEFAKLGIMGVEDAVFMKAVEGGTLVGRGSWFFAEADAEHNDMFVRVTFAAAESEQMIEAMKRLGKALRFVFELPPMEE